MPLALREMTSAGHSWISKTMRFKPESEPLRMRGGASPNRARASRLEPPVLEPIPTEGLERALGRTPAVRRDKVLEAMKLLQDRSYPASELIVRLSAFLARHMNLDRSIGALRGAKRTVCGRDPGG
jgi:hypothetical protein